VKVFIIPRSSFMALGAATKSSVPVLSRLAVARTALAVAAEEMRR
jgi:hypothetical protein